MSFGLGGLSNLLGGNSGDSSYDSGGILNKDQDNISESYTTTLGAQTGGFAVSTGGGAVSIADPNTIEKAFKFASETLGLLEKNVGAAQSSYEKTIAQSLATTDAERTGGSQRLLLLSGAAFAAIVGILWVMRN